MVLASPLSELRIELERADGRYCPGELIRGELVVSVARDCHCKALPLTLSWGTEGRGKRDGAIAVELDMGAHRWAASSSVRLPFAMTAPDGPLTFAGSKFAVTWQLAADAKMDWARDKPSACPIELVAWQSDPIVEGTDGYRSGVKRWQGRYHLGPFADKNLTEPSVPEPSWLLRQWRRIAPVAEMTLSLSERELSPGSVLDVTLHYQTAQMILCRRMYITLRCEEQVSYQADDGEDFTEKGDLVHEFHEDAHAMALRPHQPATIEAHFRLADDAPISFEAEHHALRWCVEADIHLIDDTSEYLRRTLIVRPAAF